MNSSGSTRIAVLRRPNALLALLLAGALMGGVASARPADDPQGRPEGAGVAAAMIPNPRMLDRMAQELGLTDAQRGKIKSAFEAARPEMQKLREQLRTATKDLRGLDAGDAQYLAKATEASKRIGDLTARMVVQAAQLRSTVWQTLTAEQRGKLEARMAKMRERREDFRERMRERMERRGDDRRWGRGEGRPPRGPDGPPPPRGM
jgi:Spy/CpxP family protein refolding chaperone